MILTAACACSLLKPTATPPPAFYSLDLAAGASPVAAPPTAPTLIVNPPTAAAGFDSQRIIYVRETYKLEYFAHSEWVDPPARMLMPLLAAVLERTGAFRAVVLTPSAAVGDLRLDTEIIRLQHEFLTQPSQVRFTLRAHLVDARTRRVLAWREFEAVVPAASENPYGGVVAANRAVQTVLEELAASCAWCRSALAHRRFGRGLPPWSVAGFC
jgi:cholesterol transport system auxiliary component